MLCQLTFPSNFQMLYDENVWVCDTAATCHSTPHGQGMTNLKDAKHVTTTMGNGSQEKATKIGDLPVTMHDKHGDSRGGAVLQGVQLLPSGIFNLFSATKLLKKGWVMSGTKESIKLSPAKGGIEIVFDMKIPTSEGVLYAMYMTRNREVANAAPTTKTKKMTTMTVSQAHAKLGHPSEDITRAMAKNLGWTIKSGGMGVCEDCSLGKAKQKNIYQKKDTEEEDPQGETGRVYLDITTIKAPKGEVISKPNWRIIVDERTGMKFSDFFGKKNDMVEPTCELFQRWQNGGKPAKIVRMDNAGENKLLEKRCGSADWKLPIVFEYTARDTPQHNHKAEVGIATIANRGRALMAAANIPLDLRYQVGYKAFQMATLLDNLTPVTIEDKTMTRYEHWAGQNPGFVEHLRTWGEAGTVKVKSTATPKIADRGVQCMLVGYALKHAGDCYEMLNLSTKRIMVTRDVIWLHRMYFPKPVKSPEFNVEPVIEEVAEQVRVGEGNTAEAAESNETENSEERESEGIQTRSGRVVNAPSRLIEEVGNMAFNYEIQLTDGEKEYYETMKNTEFGFVGAGLGGGFEHTSELHPMKYDEAMSKPDKDKWKKGVEEELQRMLKSKVFKAVPKSKVPPGAKILTSTWAMKKKANGTYRARINARGFEQIEGEHYDATATAAPVVNEATIFIVLIVMVMGGMYAELMDVRGAFLHGTFPDGETLYMSVPQGFENYYGNEVVLLLLKTIYGLKQAAYAYWTALLAVLKKIGLQRSKADPCLYFRWTKNGLNMWTSWVDDLLECGHKSDVIEGKESLKKHFDIDEVGELTEYIGCKVKVNREEGWIRLTQPVLLQSFEDEFEMPGGAYPNTPAAPGSMLLKGETKLSNRDHSKYRSGVGKMIHLSKFSRPEINNIVRELSRFGSEPGESHMRAMLRAMKYCLGTPERGILLKPDAKWDGSKNFEFTISG